VREVICLFINIVDPSYITKKLLKLGFDHISTYAINQIHNYLKSIESNLHIKFNNFTNLQYSNHKCNYPSILSLYIVVISMSCGISPFPFKSHRRVHMQVWNMYCSPILYLEKVIIEEANYDLRYIFFATYTLCIF
jgi:hypothetical protein